MKKRTYFDLEHSGDSVVFELHDDGSVIVAAKVHNLTSYVVLDSEQRISLITLLTGEVSSPLKWQDA